MHFFHCFLLTHVQRTPISVAQFSWRIAVLFLQLFSFIRYRNICSSIVNGFSVAMIVDAGCGRTLQEPQGTFGSPASESSAAVVAADDSWPHTELCQWRIQATHGEKIVLNVTMLDLPDSVDCATSYVEVRDGPSIKSPLIGQRIFPMHLSSLSSCAVRILTCQRWGFH